MTNRSSFIYTVRDYNIINMSHLILITRQYNHLTHLDWYGGVVDDYILRHKLEPENQLAYSINKFGRNLAFPFFVMWLRLKKTDADFLNVISI